MQLSSLALKMSRLTKVSQYFRPSQIIQRTFKSPPDPPPSPRLQFSVGGVEKVQADNSLQAWLASMEGRKKMATWVGFGGALGIITGFWCFKILFMEWIRDEYMEDGPQISLRARAEGYGEEVTRTPQLLKLLSDCQERSGLDDANIDSVDVFHR